MINDAVCLPTRFGQIMYFTNNLRAGERLELPPALGARKLTPYPTIRACGQKVLAPKADLAAACAAHPLEAFRKAKADPEGGPAEEEAEGWPGP